MKEAELRKHANCSICRLPVLANGLPLFYRVTVERFGIDLNAVRRQTGLAMMMGNAELAAVMGPGDDMARPFGDPAVLTLCETCSMADQAPVAVIWEGGQSSSEQPEPA